MLCNLGAASSHPGLRRQAAQLRLERQLMKEELEREAQARERANSEAKRAKKEKCAPCRVGNMLRAARESQAIQIRRAFSGVLSSCSYILRRCDRFLACLRAL